MAFRTLNAESARAADNRQSGITQPGKFVGTLLVAEYVQKTTSSGISFSFKTTTGQEARWYSNLTYEDKSTHQPTDNEGGFQELDSLMACLRLRDLPDPVMGEIEKWDAASQSRQLVRAPLLAALMGKPIGALFRMEEYLSDSGEVKEKALFDTWFSPSDEKIASEVLDGDKCKEPKRLAARVDWIAANPVKRLKGGSASKVSPPGRREQPQPKKYNDIDDDIPFSPIGLENRVIIHCI
jgi:hypothetical protein